MILYEIKTGGKFDERKKTAILEAVKSLARNYNKEEMLLPQGKCSLPSRSVIIELVRELRAVLFPGYFRIDTGACAFPDYYAGSLLNNLYDSLKEQIEIAILYQGEEKEKAQLRAEEITGRFVKRLPEIQKMLLKDVQAGFDGDPAAKSKEEIIFSYPGFYAIYVYRIAHELYLEKVPFIPRIMSEFAHGKTGIDINPGGNNRRILFYRPRNWRGNRRDNKNRKQCKNLSGSHSRCAFYKNGAAACRCKASPYD